MGKKKNSLHPSHTARLKIAKRQRLPDHTSFYTIMGTLAGTSTFATYTTRVLARK